MPSQPPDFKPGQTLTAAALQALKAWAVRKHIVAGPGLAAVESPSGTVLSVDGASIGGVSYARVGPAGIGPGVAGLATLLAPDGTDRWDITLTNGWSGGLDPGTRVFVGRDFLTNIWIAGPYECQAAGG